MQFYEGNKFTHMKQYQHGRMVLPEGKLEMPVVPSAGYDHLLKPIRLAPHQHEGYELTYIVEGEVCWELEDGRKLHLTGSQSAVIQPRVTHFGEWEVITPATLFWIIFKPDAPNVSSNCSLTEHVINDIDKIFERAGNTVFNCDEESKLLYKMLFTAMLRCERSAYTDQLIISRLRMIMSQILICSAELIKNDKSQEESYFQIEKIISFMKEHIFEDIAVTDMASLIPMSSARFSQYFKRETGLSPADYFRRLKCAKAREMLTSPTGKTITEIAFKLGFSSSQYFANVFKKYTGMTPKQYRQHY